MAFVKKCIEKVREIAAFLRPMNISTHSAYTSFFLILSLFPCMLLLLGILKFTPLGVKELMGLLEGFLPQTFLPLAQSLVEASYAHSSGAVVSVSAVAALWSASRGMYGLVRGLGDVYGCRDGRSYLRTRLASMVYTLLFLIVLVLTLIAYVFGNAIVDFLWMTTRPGLMLLLSLIDFRFLILLCLQTLIFAGMYAWIPRQRRSFRRSLPGAVAASLGWLLSSNLFSVYVEYFSGYTNIYGSVYGLALGLLWLYFCISLVFYGGALNCWIFRGKTEK